MASSSHGSLSSVVSGLVRAQMGSTLPQTVNDDDLDRHVADLILKEAKQKAQRYAELGIRAFVAEQATNAAKTDKRFLTAILRRTDDHNQSVIRAQAEQAAAIKAELEEKERKERRARAKEATDAGKDRMRRLLGGQLGGGSASSSSSSRRDRKEREHRESDRRREERRRRPRERDYDNNGIPSDDDSWRERRRRDKSRSTTVTNDRTRHSMTSTRRRSTSRSRNTPDPEAEKSTKQLLTTTRSPSRDAETQKDETPPCKRRRTESSRSPSPEGLNTTYHWRRSRSPGDSDTRSERSRRRRSFSPTTLSDDEYGPQLRAPATRPKQRQPSPQPSPEPYEPPRRGRGRVAPAGAGPNMSSKMDRYFESSYDPRLDHVALSAPNIPSTGLLDDADFAGWEAMLDLIKVRREDKAERKWLEKHGLAKEDVPKPSKPAVGDSLGLMDIQYKKRGSTREWDMGKERFD